ncbi:MULTISPECIES: LuxR C-terminal-related transcriptional regulator [unclassified Nocardiopsis]|uniref:LuxR C-terminal-related transcriptional regulator n=1 Tax=Nocardiopsis TaxID=2013 RepID=UPI00387AE2B3
MRIVIAEDNVLLSAGLEALLTAKGFEVAAVAGDAGALAAAVDRHRPGLALVDVRLPPDFRDEGLRAAIALRARHPDLAVLVLSQYVERRYAGELLADGRGGVGYLLKDRVGRVGEFVDALHRVAAGGTVMDPEVVAQLLARRDGDPVGSLTRREREVLALMAEGADNREIAERLVVGENAVHKHIGNIFAKLGMAPADPGHRRVRAVLAYLDGERR